jgi:ferric-dicitrate binding protein FerR (iron transport regulator)
MSLREAKQFVAHFVTGDYTPEGYATFLQWLRAATMDELNAIADEHEALHVHWPLPVDGPSSSPTSLWVAELEEKLDVVSREMQEQGEGIPVRSMDLKNPTNPTFRGFSRRRVWVAAASVIVVLSAGGLWYTRQHAGQHEKSNISSQDQGLPSLMSQRVSQVISTPRGRGQKQLTALTHFLPDGSRVWLNAASTLKYPLAFSGSERVVELSGEGFFEVAKNSAMPFRVRIKDAEVEVLGTRLNIMAYENDKVSRTTLIEGSVELIDRSGKAIDGSGGVEGHSEQKELQPGQQAVMAYPSPGNVKPSQGNVKPSQGIAGGIEIVTIEVPNSVIAWKDGLLQFSSADLTTVMHTVERYYDVDIQFDQSMSGKLFTGSFPRGDKLEHVLKTVTGFYTLQYKTDGKSVTVTH